MEVRDTAEGKETGDDRRGIVSTLGTDRPGCTSTKERNRMNRVTRLRIERVISCG